MGKVCVPGRATWLDMRGHRWTGKLRRGASHERKATRAESWQGTPKTAATLPQLARARFARQHLKGYSMRKLGDEFEGSINRIELQCVRVRKPRNIAIPRMLFRPWPEGHRGWRGCCWPLQQKLNLLPSSPPQG